jgi:hypothetical protein
MAARELDSISIPNWMQVYWLLLFSSTWFPNALGQTAFNWDALAKQCQSKPDQMQRLHCFEHAYSSRSLNSYSPCQGSFFRRPTEQELQLEMNECAKLPVSFGYECARRQLTFKLLLSLPDRSDNGTRVTSGSCLKGKNVDCRKMPSKKLADYCRVANSAYDDDEQRRIDKASTPLLGLGFDAAITSQKQIDLNLVVGATRYVSFFASNSGVLNLSGGGASMIWPDWQENFNKNPIP